MSQPHNCCCVAHWNIWCHLPSSSWFAAYPLSFLCRRWWGPSKSFFVGMKFFCKWKCPLLNQFRDILHVWQFRYCQERRQLEKRQWTLPRVKVVIFQRPIVELCKKWVSFFFFFLLSIDLRDNTCARYTVPAPATIVCLMHSCIVRPTPVLLPYFVHVLPWNLDILSYFLWRLLLRVVSITMDTKTRSAARKYGILPFCKQHFKRISLNENCCIVIQISLEFGPTGTIENRSSLVQIVVWCITGDKPFLTGDGLVCWRIYAASSLRMWW